MAGYFRPVVSGRSFTEQETVFCGQNLLSISFADESGEYFQYDIRPSVMKYSGGR